MAKALHVKMVLFSYFLSYPHPHPKESPKKVNAFFFCSHLEGLDVSIIQGLYLAKSLMVILLRIASGYL